MSSVHSTKLTTQRQTNHSLSSFDSGIADSHVLRNKTDVFTQNKQNTNHDQDNISADFASFLSQKAKVDPTTTGKLENQVLSRSAAKKENKPRTSIQRQIDEEDWLRTTCYGYK